MCPIFKVCLKCLGSVLPIGVYPLAAANKFDRVVSANVELLLSAS